MANAVQCPSVHVSSGLATCDTVRSVGLSGKPTAIVFAHKPPLAGVLAQPAGEFAARLIGRGVAQHALGNQLQHSLSSISFRDPLA